MTIVEKRIHLDSRWFSPERDVSRTKGVHLSHVIDFIEWQEGKHARSENDDLSDAGHAYAVGGFLWERVLQNMLERNPTELWEWLYGRVLAEPDNPNIIRPGEQCLDGGECPKCSGRGFVNASDGMCETCNGTGRVLIYLTPDGYNIESSCLEEWKYTTKSAATKITDKKFRRWLSFQIPAYLKALNLKTCQLRVYFAKGDYVDVIPQWREYLLTYTQLEIDETWDCISQNAKTMLKP